MEMEEEIKKLKAMLQGTIGEAVNAPVKRRELLEALHSIRHAVDGLHTMVVGITKYNNMPQTCTDAEGKPLKVGDALYCNDGTIKRVIAIGYKWAELSVSSKSESDGIWYQPAIVVHRFALSKEYAAQKADDDSKHFLE